MRAMPWYAVIRGSRPARGSLVGQARFGDGLIFRVNRRSGPAFRLLGFPLRIGPGNP